MSRLLNPLHRQKGMALVTVMIIMMIATFLAAMFSEQMSRALQRSSRFFSQTQLYAMALGVEQIAMQGLIADKKKDIKDNREVDDCSEGWAMATDPIPYEGAVFQASLQDLQGRFNLNNLVTLSDEGEWVRDPEAVVQLQRLLRELLPKHTSEANALPEQLADWIDSNSTIDGLEGAEDGDYNGYRTANRPLVHESEMRALLTATPELFDTGKKDNWLQYVAALPVGTPVNINTAPRAVLKSLHESIQDSVADDIVSRREESPFTSVDEFLALEVFKELNETDRNALSTRIDVKSRYFQIVSSVATEEQILRLISRIDRPDQYEPRVVQRDLSGRFLEPESACNPE